MDKQQLVQRWTAQAARLLVGRTIVAVSYLDEDSQRDLLWDRGCIVITLDNGVRIYPAADDEGNGPGALFTNSPDLLGIPVI